MKVALARDKKIEGRRWRKCGYVGFVQDELYGQLKEQGVERYYAIVSINMGNQSECDLKITFIAN